MNPFAVPGHAEVVIAGGGFAGAATAFSLIHKGIPDVVLLEAEDQFGVHASGLNAALARQLVDDPAVRALAMAGARAIRDGFHGDPVDYRCNGSILLFEGAGPERLIEAARQAAAEGLDCAPVGHDEVVAAMPVLETAAFDGAILTRDDGVVDVNALLWRFLGGARDGGARLFNGCPVTGVEVAGGRVEAVSTPAGRIGCRVLVDAAGAWANGVAGLAGARPLRMAPFRRHLVLTPALPWVDPAWPFVWDTSHGYYFRPEVGGLLMSPCDESRVDPGPGQRDPAVLEMLAEKLSAFAPGLSGVPVKHYWAGLRTITEDDRFAIGWDGEIGGLFWVAGLGGHGMTSSFAVGELAASIIAEGARTGVSAAVDPRRLKC